MKIRVLKPLLSLFVLIAGLQLFTSCSKDDVKVNAKFAGVWTIHEIRQTWFLKDGSVDTVISYSEPGRFELYNYAEEINNLLKIEIPFINSEKFYLVDGNHWFAGTKEENRLVFTGSQYIFAMSVTNETKDKHIWTYYIDYDSLYTLHYKEEYFVERYSK